MNAEDLDKTFQALADPTRRAIVARLSDGRRESVSALAQPFAMSLPAVMKHVRILEEAGIVRREKTGRTVHCRLEAEAMRAAQAWLEDMARFWSARLDALADLIEEDAREGPAPRLPKRKQREEGKP